MLSAETSHPAASNGIAERRNGIWKSTLYVLYDTSRAELGSGVLGVRDVANEACAAKHSVVTKGGYSTHFPAFCYRQQFNNAAGGPAGCRERRHYGICTHSGQSAQPGEAAGVGDQNPSWPPGGAKTATGWRAGVFPQIRLSRSTHEKTQSGPAFGLGAGQSDGMAAIPLSVSSSSDDMVQRPRVRPIDQDDRIAQHLKARMFWPQDKGLADGNGPTTSKKPATELIESPRGATATPKPDAKQDGADKDLLPDKAVGGSGTVPMGDHAESLVRCSDRPGRARGGPAGAADCTPKRVRETAAAQQRCEERRPKHACRAADLAQLWKGSDTDSRHWQLPAAQAGRIASEWGREASGTGRQGEGGRVAAMDPQWGF